MDCGKCFEEFTSQEEYSMHLRGHYGPPSLVPSYYSKTDYHMGRDYPETKKISWLSKTDLRKLLFDTYGAT